METWAQSLSFILSCEAVNFFVTDILAWNTDIWPTVETAVSAFCNIGEFQLKMWTQCNIHVVGDLAVHKQIVKAGSVRVKWNEYLALLILLSWCLFYDLKTKASLQVQYSRCHSLPVSPPCAYTQPQPKDLQFYQHYGSFQMRNLWCLGQISLQNQSPTLAFDWNGIHVALGIEIILKFLALITYFF